MAIPLTPNPTTRPKSLHPYNPKEARVQQHDVNARMFLVNRDLTAGDQVRVNIRCLANTAAIRREKRNGRDVIVVPSATMPDDVIMNGIRYPADEIAKSFKSLERTPAPLGHPRVNGKYVLARDPEALNQGWIGAWNENVRQEGGRVLLDKVIDVQRANESEGGKRVLAAIEAQEPVHTSTGLMAKLDAANGAVDHKFTARDIDFDHDALLLDEPGAATPEQGVGMMVNAAGNEIQVVNSVFQEEADRELGWAVESAVRAIEKSRKASLMERVKTALIEALSGSEREQPSEQQNKDADMTVSKEQFDALSGEVKTLSEGVSNIGTTIAEAVANAVKPLIDAQTEITANAKAKDEAERTELVGKIVKANILTEADAKELTLNAARALAKKAEPGKAAALNAAFGGTGADDEFTGVDLNAALEVK